MATEEEVQYWVDELDDEARLAAQKEFTNSIGAEVEELCIRLKEEVAKRYLLICNGDRPKPFGAFDRDEIQRLLAYNLNFTYDGYEIDEFSDFSGSIESCMDEVSKVTDSEEAWSRYEFVIVFRKYLETAAAFAKSIGATPAMRLYMRAFLILESLNSDSNLSPEDARRFAMFEKSATEMLVADYLATKLPPFKAASRAAKKKSSAKKSAKKAVKAKGGRK